MPHSFNLNKNEISCWLWSLSILCLCFSPQIFNFIWGNHDWMPILNDAGLSAGLIEGRFSQFLLLNIFLSGKILPVFNLLFGFALYTLALVLLCTRFFRFSLAGWADKLILATIATLPYINEIIYFHFIAFSLLGWTLIIALSLIAAQKASESSRIRYTLISALLLFLAAGGYPASISLFAVAVCLYAISEPRIKKLIPFAVSFILALAPIPLIYNLLKQNGLMLPRYNTETEPFINLIRKIPETLSYSVQSLFQPQPFFPFGFKLITILIIVLFCIWLNKEYSQKRRLCISLMFIPAILLALKLPLWLSHQISDSYYATRDPTAFMVRGDFYALPVLLMFSLFYLVKSGSQKLRNILLVLSAALLWFNINLNLSFCKTMLLGFKAENLLIQRLTDRIQSHPRYNPNTTYYITQTGEFYFRLKYHTPAADEKFGYYTLHTPFGRYWTGGEHFNFYAPQNFSGNQIPISPEHITGEMIDYVHSPAAIWPSADAIYLNHKYCILSLTAEGKQPLIQQIDIIQRQLR